VSSPVSSSLAMPEVDDDPTFDSGDSGASQTYPQQAGEIKKGSHLMIKGHPCKCIEVSTSKTGKHGHAKAHIVAMDIFTNKKMEDLCPCSHNLDVPFVTRTELQALCVNEDDSVGLLLVSGDTKDELNLPDAATGGPDASDEDKKTSEELKAALEAGHECYVIVLAACGMEKIVGPVKVKESK